VVVGDAECDGTEEAAGGVGATSNRPSRCRGCQRRSGGPHEDFHTMLVGCAVGGGGGFSYKVLVQKW